MTENENMLKFAWALKDHYPDIFTAHINLIVQTCITCICVEKCAVDISIKCKKQIGQFLLNYVNSNHPDILTGMAAQLTQTQKDKLNKYTTA